MHLKTIKALSQKNSALKHIVKSVYYKSVFSEVDQVTLKLIHMSKDDC